MTNQKKIEYLENSIKYNKGIIDNMTYLINELKKGTTLDKYFNLELIKMLERRISITNDNNNALVSLIENKKRALK